MNVIKLKIDLSTVLMTDIKLWDKAKNGYSSLYIAIDTGASVTTISKEILHHAGYDVSTGDIRKFTTASGVEYVRAITLEKIKLDTYEMGNVLVYAHTFPQESFVAGVLGLNVLSEFDVNILFSKGLMELARIPKI